jgi:hypothetical protein
MSDVAENGQVLGDVAVHGDDAEHPAGRIRVSRLNMIGMRVGALAGFAMASMAVAGVFAHVDTTSSKL